MMLYLDKLAKKLTSADHTVSMEELKAIKDFLFENLSGYEMVELFLAKWNEKEVEDEKCNIGQDSQEANRD